MKALESARLQRVIMTILWMILGTYLFLALLTYSSFDAGWTHVSSDMNSLSNAMGSSGAWIADLLIAFIGKAAYVLPIFILLETVQIWWPFSFVGRGFRWAGQSFILVILAVLCSMHFLQPTDAIANASGGVLGFELGHALLNLADIRIVTAILVAMLVLVSTLSFGIYWNKTLDTLGKVPSWIAALFYRNVPEENELDTVVTPKRTQPVAAQDTILGDDDLPDIEHALHRSDDFSQTAALAAALVQAPTSTHHSADSTASTESPFLFEANAFNKQEPNASALDVNQHVTDVLEEFPAEVREVGEGGEVRKSPILNLDAVDVDNTPQVDVFEKFLQEMGDVPPPAQPNTPTIPMPTVKDVAPPEENIPPQVSREDVFDRAIKAFENIEATPLPSSNTVKAMDAEDRVTDAFGRPISRSMQVVQHRAGLSPLPSLDLLEQPDPTRKVSFSKEQLERLSKLLEIKLKEFNIVAEVKDAQPGPVVTRFELELAAGIKASKVTGIARDLARSLSMASVRVVEIIPGKPYIGIEVPNSKREMVRLIELLQTPAYRDPKALVSMAMGKDIAGRPVLTDLAKAPHMLVAGTTGSGKSVAVNAMLLSMLLKYTPSQLRLILIDPKQLELSNYNDIPHLLTPVVTDMKDATNALNWCVGEMERRYKLLAFLKVRNLEGYNEKVTKALESGEDLIDPLWKPEDTATQHTAPRLKELPLIVVVADEFADMIMQVGKKAEDLIQRLAQKARAAGIHLILATQRPSVDVITGLIKANIPTRVALRVNSKIDSRTILDEGGAEYLLGHGDMLFLAPGKNEPERVHGAFISDDEVNKICDAWRERGSPDYVDDILTPYDEDGASKGGGYGGEEGDPERDVMYDQCVAFILETRKVSASSLQRKFSLGYNRAARIIDTMEAAGIISAATGPSGKREILV